MDQFVCFHFNVAKNDRNYQLLIQPGAPFEDIQDVLEQFKVDFAQLQEDLKEKERVAQEEAAKEAVPVEAELV